VKSIIADSSYGAGKSLDMTRCVIWGIVTRNQHLVN